MRRRILSIALLAFSLGAVPYLWAEAPEKEAEYAPMVAEFSVDQTAFGDQVVLNLSFTLPEDGELSAPPKIDGLGDIPLLAVENTDTGLALTLLASTLDALEVDALRLAYKTRDGAINWFESQPVKITVDNALPDDPSKLQPRPIKGLIPGKPFWLRHGPELAGGLLLLILAGILAWLYVSRRQKYILAAPSVPPHEIALRDLDNLEARWREFDEDKDGYFRLTMIIRSYMGAIRPFSAADLTTDEIRSRIKDPVDREIFPLLSEADMVKFAGTRIAEATRKQHLAMAREYVEKTMPVEEDATVVQAEIMEEKISGRTPQ